MDSAGPRSFLSPSACAGNRALLAHVACISNEAATRVYGYGSDAPSIAFRSLRFQDIAVKASRLREDSSMVPFPVVGGRLRRGLCHARYRCWLAALRLPAVLACLAFLLLSSGCA